MSLIWNWFWPTAPDATGGAPESRERLQPVLACIDATARSKLRRAGGAGGGGGGGVPAWAKWELMLSGTAARNVPADEFRTYSYYGPNYTPEAPAEWAVKKFQLASGVRTRAAAVLPPAAAATAVPIWAADEYREIAVAKRPRRFGGGFPMFVCGHTTAASPTMTYASIAAAQNK